MKKLDHNYSESVKKQIKKTKEEGEKALVRKSCNMTFRNAQFTPSIYFHLFLDSWSVDALPSCLEISFFGAMQSFSHLLIEAV